MGPAEIAAFLDDPRVVGVAEVMDFPGVLAAHEEVLRKVLLAEMSRKVTCDHAPLVRGASLQAYLSAGILSDHETTGAEEGLEKLRKTLLDAMIPPPVTVYLTRVIRYAPWDGTDSRISRA